ncbi:membrane protein [Alcaligenes pakistanensis]|uniref:Membrane protein n=1 Tax=Alcaligenes pakistanensis TaxID=1482717 RepID=A0A8H9IKK4_9BURK|nr:NfeD family protein [Alcaligenes pakistanensis]MBP6621085.1 NfeD family protein [Alcaligenes sp.]GHC58968.1 membrane protein [Alcaligenes pakistanensis]HCA17264.1 NfeD family protein [Alcaligenes faecalis]
MLILAFIFDSFWYWLVAGVVLIATEVVVSGVYLLWLGLGALTVGLFTAAWPDAPSWLQWLILAIAMLGWVVVGVRWQRRSRASQPDVLNTGLSGYVGARALVSDNFVNGRGRIRLNDSYYSATATQDLEQGVAVVVLAVDGAEMRVQAVE